MDILHFHFNLVLCALALSIWNLRFPQHCHWGVRSSGRSCCISG